MFVLYGMLSLCTDGFVTAQFSVDVFIQQWGEWNRSFRTNSSQVKLVLFRLADIVQLGRHLIYLYCLEVRGRNGRHLKHGQVEPKLSAQSFILPQFLLKFHWSYRINQQDEAAAVIWSYHCSWWQLINLSFLLSLLLLFYSIIIFIFSDVLDTCDLRRVFKLLFVSIRSSYERRILLSKYLFLLMLYSCNKLFYIALRLNGLWQILSRCRSHSSPS